MLCNQGIRWARVWIGYVKVGFLRSTFYPLDLLGQAISLFTYLMIFFLILSNTGQDLVSGFNYWLYVSIFYVVIQMPQAGVFTGDIRSGRILLIETQPTRHLLRLHGQLLGQRLPYAVLCLVVFFLFVSERPSGYQLMLLPFFLLFSFTFALTLDALISLAAFSVPYVLGVGELKSNALLLFSGIIIFPPELPWILDDIAYCTPFPWLVYEPAIAFAEGENQLKVCFIQLVWSIVLGGFYLFFERRIYSRQATFGG